MPSRLRLITDLRWSDSGDFVIDTNDNDLKDTSKENYQGAIQHIETRLQSNPGDWASSPETGTKLNRFVGKPNTAATGADIETAIYNGLTRGGFISPAEIQVTAFPISVHSIMSMVYLRPKGQQQVMQIPISYNLQDNKISLRS